MIYLFKSMKNIVSIELYILIWYNICIYLYKEMNFLDNTSSSNHKQQKKLNSMKSLSLLDNIINRNTDDDDVVDTTSHDDNISSKLDDISISSQEDNTTKDMTKDLDNILLSSQMKLQSKPTKVSNIAKEMVNPSNVDVNQQLDIHEITFTTNKMPIKILKILPKFEHTYTYICRYMNNNHILRWYNSSTCKNLVNLRAKLEKLQKSDEKNSYILTPKVLTKPSDNGCFGCVYTELTQEYFTLIDIINGYTIEYDIENVPTRKNVKFKSINAMINASINIAKMFLNFQSKDIHMYSFYGEDLFINIDTGDILFDITNSIYVSNDLKQTNLECTYLAPEILKNIDVPNTFSDNYTLAVILFRIFFHDHPLEGKSVIDDTSLNFKERMKHYSDNAIFILDPNNTSNRAIRGVNFTVLSMWNKYPDYLKDAFTKTFCDYLFNPSERITIEKWLTILLHLKCNVLPCVCGRVDFSVLYELTEESFYKCQRCGSKYHSMYFKKNGFTIPVYDGNNIYSFLFKDKVSSYDEVMGIIMENKIHKNLFGLKNLSNAEWICDVSNKETKVIKPLDVLPIFAGNTVDFYGSIAEFDFIQEK